MSLENSKFEQKIQFASENARSISLHLTSLGKGGTNVPPIFKIALKKLFHIDS